MTLGVCPETDATFNSGTATDHERLEYVRLFVQPDDEQDSPANWVELHLTDAFLDRLACLIQVLTSTRLESVTTIASTTWNLAAGWEVDEQTRMEVHEQGLALCGFASPIHSDSVTAPLTSLRASLLWGSFDEFREHYGSNSSESRTPLDDICLNPDAHVFTGNADGESDNAEPGHETFESRWDTLAEAVGRSLQDSGLLPLRLIAGS